MLKEVTVAPAPGDVTVTVEIAPLIETVMVVLTDIKMLCDAPPGDTIVIVAPAKTEMNWVLPGLTVTFWTGVPLEEITEIVVPEEMETLWVLPSDEETVIEEPTETEMV